MESRAKLLGHAIHPIMIVFPLGLLSTAVIFDVIYLLRGNPTFATVAYYMIAAGIIGGFAAAIFGAIDWLAIPSGTRAKSVGVYHAVGNVFGLRSRRRLARRRAGRTARRRRRRRRASRRAEFLNRRKRAQSRASLIPN